jgi:hypothetical protein
VWYDAFMMLPNRAGAYYPNNLFANHANVAALTSPGTTLRAWCALYGSDSVTSYIGTTTKLWQYDGVTTFTDQSKVGAYTNTATDWSFAQYGNYSIATNRVDAVQVRDASGAAAFADLAGSPPKARIAVTQSEQVLLFDLNDGAEKPNAFAACAPGDHTDWSGAGATTATAIRHRPGRITAAIAFRDFVLVFKRSSVFKLTYTGATYKWKVELIATGRGAWAQHDAVVCGDLVVFSGPGGAWSFDGASFRPLTDWVGEIPESMGSFFSPLSQSVHFVRKHSTVLYITLLGVDFVLETTPELFSYNLVGDAWGSGAFYDATEAVNSGLNYVPMTGDSAALSALVAPTAALPDLMWLVDVSNINNKQVVKNNAYWGNGNATLNGSAGAAKLVGSVEGVGHDVVTDFKRLTPQFTMSLRNLSADPRASNTELKLSVQISGAIDAMNGNDSSLATYAQQGISSSGNTRRFDFLASSVYARFHLYFPQTSGYLEILDYTLDQEAGGKI